MEKNSECMNKRPHRHPNTLPAVVIFETDFRSYYIAI